MSWPIVRFGELALQRKESIVIDDMREYLRCRVQLHAQGVVERDRLPGAMIKTKQQQVCRAGEFLVAEIDAKHGGYGIVPDALDGAIVSSHYFLFEIDETRLDRRFLGYFAKTPAFLDQVNAQGTTNYAAIRPQQVLEYEIPLPPLAEQRRIVAKIERLAGKIEEARGLRQSADLQIAFLQERMRTLALETGMWPKESMAYLLTEEGLRNGISVKEGEGTAGIRCLRLSAMRNGRLFIQDNKLIPLTAGEAEPYLLNQNDIFVVRGNGSRNLVGRAALSTEDSPKIVYPDLFIKVLIRQTVMLPQFFVICWNSPAMRQQIIDTAKTTSGIWKINQQHIRSFQIPVPPLDVQQQIVMKIETGEARISLLQGLQTQVSAELDALLPAMLDRAFKGEL